MITKLDIEKAYLSIRDQVFRTPLVYSQKLSQLCGCQTLFKLGNLPMTGSFKERGALPKLLSLSFSDRPRGVIAASAGNHGQAVAYHCQRLGIKAKIIMPQGTPLIKVLSTQNYGAEVILHGSTVDDAAAEDQIANAILLLLEMEKSWPKERGPFLWPPS